MTTGKRIAAAAIVIVVCMLAGVIYLQQSGPTKTSATGVTLPDLLGRGSDPKDTPSVSSSGASTPTTKTAANPVRLMYISRAADAFGKLVVAEGSPLTPKVQALSCERVAFGGTRGICLQSSGGVVPTYSGLIVDRNYQQTAEFGLGGLPSRARVSPNGRWGAVTVFVTGHAYTGAGEFSTRTTLIDLNINWHVDLEQFAVFKDGEPYSPTDRNLWGITFTPDSNAFYATMKTGSTTYLMKGDPANKRLDVVAETAECPAISPDGKTIAFKLREGDRYRLVAFNVANGQRRVLEGAGYLDDQVEWLDNHTVLFGVDRSTLGSGRRSDIWKYDLDTGAERTIVAESAESPIVLR